MGAALVLGGTAADGAGLPGATEAATEGLVACGVLATVESPEPQPLDNTATNASGARRLASDHTSGTVPSPHPAAETGALAGGRRPANPLDFNS